MASDPTGPIPRRAAAQAERLALARDRWTRFQAASRKRYAAAAARKTSPGLTRLLARAKAPGRVLLLSRSGVWDEGIDAGLGSIPGPTAALSAYVRAGPNPGVQPRALFDQSWYLTQAAGLAGSQWAPLAHYLVVGDSHNLSPHPLFNAPAYRARQGARMAARGRTALADFLFEGAAEGVDPHPLFDLAYYVGQSEDVAVSGENPLVHYLRQGWRDGLDPHPLFAGAWYLDQNPDVAADGVAPLLHYVTAGAAEGRDPHPLFDQAGYLNQVGGRLRRPDPLSDFLTVGVRGPKRPNPYFQPAWYLEQTGGDPAARRNPLLHYLAVGAHQGLSPAADFDEAAYFVAHPDAEASPLAGLDHWVRHRTSRPAAAESGLSAEAVFENLRAATAPAADAYDVAAYEALRLPRTHGDAAARVIALRRSAAPDWLAVARALPNYRGHIQPRLPADGFADPADPATLRRDVALAERYGLAGFCHEVADATGLSALAAEDFPFCLAWTGPDDASQIKALAPALRAPQALKVDGRPLLLLPATSDAAAWREAAKAAGLPDLFLVQRARSGAGFDAHLVDAVPARTPEGPAGPPINPDFRGQVHDHAAIVREQLAKGFAPWPQIPCGIVAHDTTPQMQDAPVVWQDAGPGALQAWLEAAADAVRALPADHRLVFLHAWNDWETGAALAPDLRFGHGWLEAIANAADADLLER